MILSKKHFSTAHFSTAHFWEIQRWNIDFLTFVPRGQIWTMSQVFDLRAVGQKMPSVRKFSWISKTGFFHLWCFQLWIFSKLVFANWIFQKTFRGQSPVLQFFWKKNTCFEFWHSFCRQSSSSSSVIVVFVVAAQPPPAQPPPPSLRNIPPWGRGRSPP